MKLILVAGARPNFMKIAPLMHALLGHERIKPILVHTGQHYDETMSGRFFSELGIPAPDYNLEVGSASQAVMTARIMERFEQVCLKETPDAVLVVGDVTSTVACSLVAVKLGIKTIHYEAGLRSNDRSMPEEINRIVTDSITDVYITTCADADENLKKEGVSAEKIFMLGNLMIDSLVANLPKIKSIKPFYEGKCGVVTFHRPGNVDEKESLVRIIDICCQLSKKLPIVFPMHPRTRKNIEKYDLFNVVDGYPDLHIVNPFGYLPFMNLVLNSEFVLTDSGGIQEETTYLNIPCLTVRPTTERPVTITEGSNKLIKVDDIISEVELVLAGKGKYGSTPKFWDGKTAKRVVELLQTM